MQIFVKKPGGKTTTLNVESCEMISSVKRKLDDKEGTTSDVLPVLYYVGKQLDDWLTLADYNILKDSVLHLFLTRKRLPHIYVRTLTGKTFTLRIVGLNTIDDVKAKIYEQEGIPPDMQSLIFDGRCLFDGNQTLLENRIGMESTLLVTQIEGTINNQEGLQSASCQLNVMSQGRYKLRKCSAPQVAPQPTESATQTAPNEANLNIHSIYDTNDGEVCADSAEYMQGITTYADPQAMSDNTYEAKLSVFALHQPKTTAALSDLMPEICARPLPSVLTDLEELKREMAQMNEGFSGQCASYESQIVALKAQNKKTEEELTIACNKEKILEATISVLTHKNKMLSAQCASYESQIVALKDENKKTEEELMSAYNKEKILEATISVLTHKNKTFSAQCTSYESQIVALKVENEKTEEELTVARSKEKELEATISGLTHKNKTISGQCASYESQIVALKGENKKTEEELTIACNKENILEATITVLTHRNKTFSAQCASYKSQIVALKGENKKTEEELAVARNKEKEQEATISGLTHKNKPFSGQCASHESQIIALEADGKKTKEVVIVAHSKEKERHHF